VKATQQIPAVAWTKTRKILFVDDTQDNLDLMVEVLEDGPWSVTSQSSSKPGYGQPTPTLLLDIAEQVVAESCIETVGAHRAIASKFPGRVSAIGSPP